MNDLKVAKPKKKPNNYNNQNLIESLRSVGTGVVDSAKYDLAKGAVNEAWDELLGINHDQATKGHEEVKVDQGELSEGAELDLTAISTETVQITEMGRQYAQEVIHAGKKASAENSQETQVRMQEILIEIKKLSQSSKELKNQVDVVAMEQSVQAPNVYSMNFLEQMLSFVQNLRIGVEDSLAWFKTIRSKNAAKQYGAQVKSQGAKYMLSGERAVATQTG